MFAHIERDDCGAAISAAGEEALPLPCMIDTLFFMVPNSRR